MNKAKLYFVVGSQDLYGAECLKQVAEDAKRMASFLDEKIGDVARRSTNKEGTSQPPSLLMAGLSSLRSARNPNTSARTAKRRGVQRRRVPSIVARVPWPDTFWMAAAA